MKLYLSRITEEALLKALDWREACMSSLRTSKILIESNQKDFYSSLNKRSDIKYFNIIDDIRDLIGIGGLVNIDMVNRLGEIAIIIDNNLNNKGYGTESVNTILNHGFQTMGLKNIFGECYKCSESYGFWEKYLDRLPKDKYSVFETTLPERKFWDGKYWDSKYFNITKK